MLALTIMRCSIIDIFCSFPDIFEKILFSEYLLPISQNGIRKQTPRGKRLPRERNMYGKISLEGCLHWVPVSPSPKLALIDYRHPIHPLPICLQLFETFNREIDKIKTRLLFSV